MAELTVRMPALSATMEDAELIDWLVDVGDEVRSGQPLAEVSTDKVDMELESPYDGTVAELLAEPGDRVELGAPVAMLSSDEEELLGDLDLGEGSPDAAEPPEPTGETTEAAAEGRHGAESTADAEAEDPDQAGRSRAIPMAPPPVRKRARQSGIDLHEVTPTGSRGHVTHKDLDAYVKEHGSERSGPVQVQSLAAAAGPDAGPPPSMPPSAQPASGGRQGGVRDRRRAIRLATARTTTRSAAIPQFTLYRSLDLTIARERRGRRSWTTELARALAAALWRHPGCNATWDDDQEQPVRLETVRIGIAVDTDDGLVVVAVDDPDGVDADEADERIRSAIDRARSGRLTPSDLEGISSTISNLGGLGVDHFDALLVPPQPTILSVGRMVESPVVVDGRVRVRPQMEVGLTVDHRVADGADGARLLDTFARRLER